MTRLRAFSIGIALIGATGALAAAKPGALTQAHPGEWELDGLPASKAPVRQCVPDIGELLTIEHRHAHCSQHVLSDDGTALKIQFTCPDGGFGTTSLRVITPRSLRIETQGIADNAPYAYVLQARRIGECPSGKAQERGH